jgi:type IV fimbrial biogenesis protein FimT
MQKNLGLTLLECLIAMALLVILLFSSVAAYRYFVSKNELNALVDQLTDALVYARDQAITSHTTITLCPNQADAHCGVNWEGELIIWDEKNQRVFRRLPAIPAMFYLKWKSTLNDSARLRWRSDGFTRGQQGSFYICAQSDDAPSAQIIILRTGRLRVVIGKMTSCHVHATLPAR